VNTDNLNLMQARSRSNWRSSFEDGQRVVKDGCGVFGILRKNGARKIGNLTAVNGISCIKYRGSNLGAGYASLSLQVGSKAPIRVKAFVDDVSTAALIERELGEVGEVQEREITKPADRRDRMAVWQCLLRTRRKDEYAALEHTVDRINDSLIQPDGINGRIFSYGRYVNVYKEVGYPLDVARLCGLDGASEEADLWIAHTRQPTNSPGQLPIWSHPFASTECAIVHNGDISSFGANTELLNSWGFHSHVGTDSEVVARLLDHLVRVEDLSITEAATVLTNPYERNLDSDTLSLLSRFKGARLDGPFAIVAGYSHDGDVYLIALTDRSKFRPLLFGEDEENYYVASEENQIRNISKDAKIWTPEPGSYFIASLKQGLIESGSSRNLDLQQKILRSSPLTTERKSIPTIDCRGKTSNEINSQIFSGVSCGSSGIMLENASGERFIGIGISIKKNFKIEIVGFPGNCLANLNDGATFEVFGNVADDVADTMHSGGVIVHGNARDVLGQALQGGDIFVRGCVGNRAAIQMREYKNARPFVLIGETADDYLGEYMAGGVVCLLNLSDSEKAVGKCVGTGMVGGAIYIRGNIQDTQIGLLPQKKDLIQYLKVAFKENLISKEVFARIESVDYPSEEYLRAILPSRLYSRVRTLFFGSKYTKPFAIERRILSSDDLQLLQPKLLEFFEVFSLEENLLRKVLSSEFTIIRTREEKVERPVPPQEVPVEE
jgi:glutamate synthase domain-containing protein 1/glutamate synthase domain-containing protein 3